VAVRAMRRGEQVTAADVEFKRPGTGIQPDELGYVIGRRLARDVTPDEELAWPDLT
jgi:sialic acid synthase SpsE